VNAVEIISKKRDGGELSADEIRFIISGVTNGAVPDYQAAAWLMTVFLRGMSRRETLDLTIAMRDSGATVDLSDLANGPALDKHSTGGVGDKTSLVVVPILAAAGVPILKMSGRGLGFSGGTIDKLEAIPGFRTNLSVNAARDIVVGVGAVMIAQSSQLAPADKILYSLRDVTATIESIPLIASSIMSKKLAAGGQRILLDVKCGKGAFMKTRERAELLAQELVAIGNGAGVPTVAVLSAMDEPIGYAVGNALEVREAIAAMQPRTIQSRAEMRSRGEESAMEDQGSISPGLPVSPSPGVPSTLFLDLCIQLAAYGLVSVGKAASLDEACAIAAGLVDSGAALRKFVELVAAQGGPDNADTILASLPKAALTIDVNARAEGYIVSVDAEAIGKLAVEMGAGRFKKSDGIDHAVGIILRCKTGAPVRQDTVLATLHLRDMDVPHGSRLADRLRAAYLITDLPHAVPESLVLGVVR